LSPRALEADLEAYAAPLLAEGEEITTPGIDTELAMTPLEVSSEEISADDTVLLATQITGENVGYIYIEAARYDEDNEVYILEDVDYVAADDTGQLDGVFYPVWTQADLDDFIVEWSPTLYTLSDGETEAFVLLEPSVYGQAESDTEYVTRGIYTLGESGETRYALMYFDGNLEYKSIYGYLEAEGTGALREITPHIGDAFTVIEQWYTLTDDDEWVVDENLGDTLFFNGEPFAVTTYAGYAGEYVLGITVSDVLDNSITEYATVTVVE
ncbi:MAG: hypothetical protein M3Q45_00140, partial [Chloroflexota bacterium]|nr:hypothetical protein [Chloroflexota bacterium]